MESVVVQDSKQEAPVIHVEDLTVFRSGKSVIHDINLKVFKGDFVAIVGPNGGGKSTLLLSILGLLRSQKGSIRIFDQPPSSKHVFGKIGWVSQAAAHLPKDVKITVQELVRLGTVSVHNMFSFMDNGRSESVQNALQMVGMECCADCNIAHLSGGQRQRAVIARALASNAELIILDEPLVGIDRDSKTALLKLLNRLCQEEGKTIIMVSHDFAAMRQTSHRLVFLEETIQFDGKTDSFPDLAGLADLRGFNDAQSDETQSLMSRIRDKMVE